MSNNDATPPVGQSHSGELEQQPPTNQPVEIKKSSNWMTTVKRFLPGAVVVLFGVLLLVLGLTISGGSGSAVVPQSADVESSLKLAERRYDANNASAEYAPQQQVVNGWYTNDLLVVVAESLDSSLQAEQVLAENQQKILSSNSRVVLFTWLSVSILLVGFGAYLILDRSLS